MRDSLRSHTGKLILQYLRRDWIYQPFLVKRHQFPDINIAHLDAAFSSIYSRLFLMDEPHALFRTVRDRFGMGGRDIQRLTFECVYVVSDLLLFERV